MIDFLLIFLSIIPGIVIAGYIIWRDRHDSEPIVYLLLCFLFGMLSTYPAVKMELFGVRDLGILKNGNMFMTFTFAFAVIAFSEEYVKFIFLRYFIYPRKDFDEPMDGIVYAIMIGMGFATLENVLYIVMRQDTLEAAIRVGLLRMFTAVPAHATFAVFMGYFIGLAKFRPQGKTRFLLIGLVSAIVAHGIYDFLLFSGMAKLAMLLGLVGTGFSLSLILIGRHLKKGAPTVGE